MIACYPIPYPDELWYSICARFSDRMRFPTETGAMLALHGYRTAVATVDLPHRVNSVVSQLPAGHPCTVDAFIDHHTALPYYSPFLPTSRCADARRVMADGSEPSIRARCGLCTSRVRPPKFFRGCPVCDRANRRQYGETYWHRLFQLPGVEVCPIHEVFLVRSDVRLDPLEIRHQYISAESQRLTTATHAIDQHDPAHQNLLGLAKDVDWLLRQERLNPGLNFLHQRYHEVLAQKGLATRVGNVRVGDLRREVVAFYGPRLLELLQCSLPTKRGDDWLVCLLRNSSSAVTPLRHLLLLRALDAKLERFFYPQRFPDIIAKAPAQAGLWPCLNPVCEHRNKLSISQAHVQPSDSNGAQHPVIKCPHCGYAYQVRDGAEQPTQATRVIDRGPIWTKVLRQQWADPKLTLRQMATTLEVDSMTVKYQAAKLGLAFPREGKRRITKRGVYVTKQRDPEKEIRTRRQAWLEIRRKRPAAGVKEIRSKAPALYAWLYRNDRAWLAQNQPPRLRPAVTLAYIDWAKRDAELAPQIATAALRLRNRSGKPQRITVTAIGRVLGKQALFESALAKLPLTRSVINGVIESSEDFAARRVYAAAARLRKAEGAFPRWKLIRAAGLYRQIEGLPKIQAALDCEMRPFVNVTIIPDGDSVPQGRIRHSVRKASHISGLSQ
jgi:hypothetical protein